MTRLLPKSVIINDDTMREGLQIESPDIPVLEKLRLLDAIGEMGAKTIPIGSFAHPKWTPSMKCIDEIAERFVPKEGVRYTALVFNQRGYERAGAYGHKLDLGRSQSFGCHVELCDTFARRNYNRTQADQLLAMRESIRAAREAQAQVASVALGNPFGSNFEGRFTHEQRMDFVSMIVKEWKEAGITINRVSFLDAMGWNMPHTVKETLEAIRNEYPSISEFHMHLHNTRGAAIASYYEALCLGVREYDTSLGGMGGCPYCGNGRAAGHVPTEDFVHLCHDMGVETGYDLAKVIEAACIAEEVVGHSLWGHVSKAGPLPEGDRLYPAEMPFVETLDEASHFRNGPKVYEGQIAPWHNSDILTRREPT